MSEDKKDAEKQPEATSSKGQSSEKEQDSSLEPTAPSQASSDENHIDKQIESKTTGPVSDQSKPAQDQAALDKEAKRKAALEARAARAQKAKEEEKPEEPKPPSPMQPLLDQAVQLIKEQVSAEAIEEAFINEIDGHRPYLIIRQEFWLETAKLLKEHPEFRLTYLRNLSGVDQETHLEVVYHLISMESKQNYCIKVKTDRDQPSIPSVTAIWETANWNEREVYDLLGIDFPGHPDMRRIMMPDDWVGHPLRKDYEPLDPEV